MNLKQTYDYGVKELLSIYPKQEAQSIVKRLMQEVYNVSMIELISNPDYTFQKWDNYIQQIKKIKQGIPLQYVIGAEYFLERKFYLSTDTLIPRPETQEMVLLAISENRDKKELRILDIGTGSGVIAISLALELHRAKVLALDVSGKALKIARKNATIHNAKVGFVEQDVFLFETKRLYDIIISNPPYVCEREKQEMRGNVLDYEPHLALFVPNEQPLKFYEKIVAIAEKNLSKNGMIYLEINEKFATQVSSLFNHSVFDTPRTINDFSGKPRIVCTKKIA